jgi:hypothetical protein
LKPLVSLLARLLLITSWAWELVITPVAERYMP